MNKDIFTSEDYKNINLEYPDGYLEMCLETLQQENKQLKERIDKAIYLEEEIMYLANKVAITTRNVEVKAVRDRLEDIFKILKGEENE